MQVISAEIQDFYRKHSYSRTDLKFEFFFLFIFVSLLFFTLIYSLKIFNFIANSIFSLIVLLSGICFSIVVKPSPGYYFFRSLILEYITYILISATFSHNSDPIQHGCCSEKTIKTYKAIFVLACDHTMINFWNGQNPSRQPAQAKSSTQLVTSNRYKSLHRCVHTAGTIQRMSRGMGYNLIAVKYLFLGGDPDTCTGSSAYVYVKVATFFACSC